VLDGLKHNGLCVPPWLAHACLRSEPDHPPIATVNFREAGLSAIPEEQWTPIPYWREGAASVAEVPYVPFGGRRTYRMIIRRVKALANGQQQLPGVGYLHFAFITDREGDMLELEADHCQHAAVENVLTVGSTGRADTRSRRNQFRV
jgi:hypothetical protein